MQTLRPSQANLTPKGELPAQPQNPLLKELCSLAESKKYLVHLSIPTYPLSSSLSLTGKNKNLHFMTSHHDHHHLSYREYKVGGYPDTVYVTVYMDRISFDPISPLVQGALEFLATYDV